MKILKALFLMSLMLLMACSSTPKLNSEIVPNDILVLEEIVVEETSLPFNDFDIQLPDLPIDSSDLVSASGNCARCHTSITDKDGNDVSFDVMWRSSMMANAAVDPYWIATVRSEILLEPELADVIEDKCVTCHMPLARFDADSRDEKTNMFGNGFLNLENELHDLAMDGVSCNLCHQIEPDNFDTVDSFSGGYQLNTTNREWGGRISYGPLPITKELADVMLRFSGYMPVQSDHIKESALCGTCHNLYTPFLDSNGNISGEFPEQMTYKE